MRRGNQPNTMFNIMRLLVVPPTRYENGKYYVRPRFIVVNKKGVSWKDQPEQTPDYWYQYDWPAISEKCFKRLVKKGWLEEIEPGANIWRASLLGKEDYRSIGPSFRSRFVRAKPTMTRYRRAKLKREKREAYWAELRAKRNQPEPEPLPLRKERPHGKYRHDGYRRQCHKHWLNDELNN